MNRHAMMAADKSRKEGTEVVQTTVPDPPRAGGVKEVPKTGNQRLTQNVGTVAKRATRRVSIGKSPPIRINLNPVKTIMEIWQRSNYAEGSEGPKTGKEAAFVMKRIANLMKKTTSQLNEV